MSGWTTTDNSDIERMIGVFRLYAWKHLDRDTWYVSVTDNDSNVTAKWGDAPTKEEAMAWADRVAAALLT